MRQTSEIGKERASMNNRTKDLKRLTKISQEAFNLKTFRQKSTQRFSESNIVIPIKLTSVF